MNYYAELGENSVVIRTVRTAEPTENMVPCDKRIIREDGSVYIGRLPRKGFWYQKEEDRFVTARLPVNVNTANFDTLRTLVGVDAVRAQAIIDGRPWASTSDLSSINGISQEMVDIWDIEV